MTNVLFKSIENFLPMVTIAYYYDSMEKDEYVVLNEVTTIGYSLTHIISGSVEFRLNDKKYILSKNDILFLTPGIKRIAVRDNGEHVKFSAVHFYCFGCNENTNGKTIELPRTTHIEDSFKFENIAGKIISLCGSNIDGKGILLSAHALNLIYLYVLANEKTVDPRIKKIKKFINDNINKPLSVSDVAKHVSISPGYLKYLFKKHIGMSIKQYITSVKLEYAMELLRTSDSTISEIAYQTGFCDIYHFSKTFKKYVGISPSSWIK